MRLFIDAVHGFSFRMRDHRHVIVFSAHVIRALWRSMLTLICNCTQKQRVRLKDSLKENVLLLDMSLETVTRLFEPEISLKMHKGTNSMPLMDPNESFLPLHKTNTKNPSTH